MQRRVVSVGGTDTTGIALAHPYTDHTFDILGRPTAESVDIGALFAQASARMGDNVWVGYVPVHGRITCRVRLSKEPIYSGGDAATVALVFDESLLEDRMRSRAFASGTCLLVDERLPGRIASNGHVSVQRVPLRARAAQITGVADGERLVALGLLAWMYGRDPDVVRRLLENRLASRGGRVVSGALRLFEVGWREAPQWVTRRCAMHVSSVASARREVLDGRGALVLGALAGHLGHCLPPPVHPLAEGFVRDYEARGGRVVPASSGAGAGGGGRGEVSGSGVPTLGVEVAGWDLDLDEDRDGVEGAAPRVTVRIERVLSDDGPLFPSRINPLTGCPGVTEGQQPLVLAPTTVEQCFTLMRLAGCVAAHYGRDVMVLVDAMLLGAVQQRTATDDDGPYDPEVVPTASADGGDGWPSGRYVVSRLLDQLAVPEVGVERFLRAASVVGGDTGDLLLVGWGATRGPVEEAVQRLRADGIAVSSVHLTSLNPLPTGFGSLLFQFKRVVALDVLTESYDAMRRLRHLHTLIRAALYTTRDLPATPKPLVQAHLFTDVAPLAPASVAAFVKQCGVGAAKLSPRCLSG